MNELRPNPGPQEAFLATSADIAIYGGAAGSGKSFAVTLDVLRHVHRKGFGAIYLRRESNRLTGPGSLWEEMSGIYPHLGSLTPRARQTPALEWRFPSGAMIQLSHLQYEKDKHAHQSKQYAGIYFEEVCEFEETQFWYLISRLRTTCGIRPYVRGTCNPDPDSFVRRLIDWWIGDDGLPRLERSGELRWFVRDGDDLVWFDTEQEARVVYPDRNPLSLTFIAASLADNPKGDPTYRDKLMAMSRVDRERLLGGNWNIRAACGEVFRRTWFPIIDDFDESQVVAECRAWDLAASEVTSTNPNPDWTAGVRVARMKDGSFVVRHVERGRMSAAKVEDTLDRTAAHDGRRCTIRLPQDPGQAGKGQATQLVARLAGKGYQAIARQVTGAKTDRAKAPSALAERGLIKIVRGPWNEALLAELESFPDGAKDDQVDAMNDAFAQLAGPVVGFPQTRAPSRLGFEL